MKGAAHNQLRAVTHAAGSSGASTIAMTLDVASSVGKKPPQQFQWPQAHGSETTPPNGHARQE